MKKFLLSILAIIILNVVVLADSAQNLYDDAIKEYKNKNYSKSVTLLKKSCEKLNAKACNKLGMMYAGKIHVNRDREKALKYFSIACKQNYEKSCIKKDRVSEKIKYEQLSIEWDKEQAKKDEKHRTKLKASRTKDNTITIDDLEWQDDSHFLVMTTYWNDANIYCKQLTLSGKTDWRLPSAK